MNTEHKVTEIFCIADDFCKVFDAQMAKYSFKAERKRKYHRESRFFGFKLHLICNEKGELLNFMITPGDVDDRKPLEYYCCPVNIFGGTKNFSNFVLSNHSGIL